MPRRSTRRTYRKTSEYAQQQTTLAVIIPNNTAAYSTDSFELVPSSTLQGKRTIAHLRVKLMSDSPQSTDTTDGAYSGFGYTIQYVPSGYTV